MVTHEEDKRAASLHQNSRAHTREDVVMSAELREKGAGKTKVSVIDLSQTGFRMQCYCSIPEDRVIFLTMPGFAQLEAKIAWRTHWIYGCEFVQPLHPSIYEHIVKTNPAFGSRTGQ